MFDTRGAVHTNALRTMWNCKLQIYTAVQAQSIIHKSNKAEIYCRNPGGKTFIYIPLLKFPSFAKEDLYSLVQCIPNGPIGSD